MAPLVVMVLMTGSVLSELVTSNFLSSSEVIAVMFLDFRILVSRYLEVARN